MPKRCDRASRFAAQKFMLLSDLHLEFVVTSQSSWVFLNNNILLVQSKNVRKRLHAVINQTSVRPTVDLGALVHSVYANRSCCFAPL